MTPTTEQQLIQHGLLPNPDGVGMSPSPQSVASDRGAEVLQAVLIGGLRELAQELTYTDRDNVALRDERWAEKRAAYHAQQALRWLVDTYEFDDLTSRVIAHALASSTAAVTP